MRESSDRWQKKLAQGFTSATELLTYLELPLTLGEKRAEEQFASRIPLSFAKRMQKGNAQDPLLLQVLASSKELTQPPGYLLDPLGEQQKNPIKGLLHKYHGRVLVTLTGVCAINCRYCFRRHFPYQSNNPGLEGLQEIVEYITKDSTIHEVILSGGDPLLAADNRLAAFLLQLETIPHLRHLRIHTRIPVVFPERIDDNLLRVFSQSPLQKIMVLHVNHPQELNDPMVHQVLRSLRQVGFYLLNQTVLLQGINDEPAVLADLSYALFAQGVLPYYLHVLDKVAGASHFDMSRAKAKQVYSELQRVLPGYLLPKLACEEPGQLSKTLLIAE